MAATDYMTTLAMSALHQRDLSGEEEDHVEAYYDLMDDAELALSIFFNFLSKTISSVAEVAYNVEINVDGSVGGSVRLGGTIEVYLCEDHVHTATPNNILCLPPPLPSPN